MKVLLAVFVMCIVSYKGVYADIDYRRLASILKTNIEYLFTYLSRVGSEVESIHTHLIQTADSINFKIAQNKQMIELHASIEAHKTSAGIKECVDLLDHKSQDVINELKSSFVDAVEKQINLSKAVLYNIQKEVLVISQNLQGQSLEKEIQTCINTPQTCRITNEFAYALKKYEQDVIEADDQADNLVDTILKLAIIPSVPTKINNEIYVPVSNCINKLI